MAAGGHPDTPFNSLDRNNPFSSEKINSVILIECARPELDAREILRAQGKSLGKRRSLVGNVGLFADQHNGFRIAFCSQRSRGLKSRLSPADDYGAWLHQRCLAGNRTIKPSRSSVTLIWQLRRLVGCRSPPPISTTAPPVSFAALAPL